MAGGASAITAPGRHRWLLHLGGLGLLAATGPGQAQNPLQWDEVKARIRSRHPAVAQLSVPALQAWLRDTLNRSDAAHGLNGVMARELADVAQACDGDSLLPFACLADEAATRFPQPRSA